MFCFMLQTPDGSWLTEIDAKSWDEVPQSIARYFEHEFGHSWTRYSKDVFNVYEVIKEKEISMMGQKEKAENDREEALKKQKEEEEYKLYLKLSKKYEKKSVH